MIEQQQSKMLVVKNRAQSNSWEVFCLFYFPKNHIKLKKLDRNSCADGSYCGYMIYSPVEEFVVITMPFIKQAS